MNIKNIIKSTFVYKYLYVPYAEKRSKNFKKTRHELFVKEGMNALTAFVDCMKANGIPYWLEFGTLLGVYRDGAFVPNELDLDIGAPLEFSSRIFKLLTNAGFKLVREFHVVGEMGLEQTFYYNGTTLDMMYFYEENGKLICTGSNFDIRDYTGKPFVAQSTSHEFIKFGLTSMNFKGLNVSIPDNTEEHLIEIYGAGFKVYDPNFKGDLNKTYYTLEEKKSIGFVEY